MYRVDLHIHSKYSGDNDSEPEEIINKAIEAGLDAIAFTEHYSYEASEFVESLRHKYNSIEILRGVEFSTPDGHCLIFGVNTDRLSIREVPLDEVIDIITLAGGVIIPTHPYRGINSMGDTIRKVKGFSAIEGFNGLNMYHLNQKAIDAARDLGLPYTGGSDAHRPEDVGSCYTEFDEPVREDNIVKILKGGNYYGVDRRKISRIVERRI
ncbi:MAG: PHP domain-containing protein [Thermodesulfovibrionales bacterium]